MESQSPLHPPDLTQESNALREAWMRHDEAFLNEYLVSSVEDPRIHFPSIFTRGLLMDWMFPGQFRELIWSEYRFGICMSFLHRTFQQRPSMGTPGRLLDALQQGHTEFQSIPIPTYILDTWQHLQSLEDPDQHYLASCLQPGTTAAGVPQLEPDALRTFQHQWNQATTHLKHPPVGVMEPACGSANDYRFLDAYGMGRFLNYRGFDICPKNIRNAKERFDSVTFEEGNVFQIQANDASVDFLYVHDLFEHLSIEGMHQGLREVCRVTRNIACLCFFNLAERTDHLVQARDGYHWNRLSLTSVCEFLRPLCQSLQVIHFSGFLNQAFGCGDYHNPGGYAIVLEFAPN